MKLTIGMIVKNEEKYLEKCLSAIKPILDNVDSELIITDTGSTDKTVEIAKKYTDKVLHFDWIKDFAAARNFGLEKASGEWFMYLDADDIFDSCDGIIDFFNSGEYKKYNSATYTSSNLTSGGYTVDYRAPRLTRITKETRFAGIIHEHLNTFGYPIKDIFDTAVHYGYLRDENGDDTKFLRNSELLLLQLEKNGDDDPIIYSQLFECYMGHDRKKAFEFLDKGIKICEQKKHFLITVMYCLKAYAYYSENDIDGALKVCEEYFGIDKSIKPGVTALDMEIYAIRASVFYRKRMFGEAATAYKYFFVINGEVRKGKLNTADLYAMQLRMSTEANYLRFMCDFLTSCLYIGASEDAIGFISNYPPADYCKNKELVSELVDIELELIGAAGEKYADICYNGLDDYGKSLFDERSRRGKWKEQYILSIGMIVKNEEKYLEKCLSAIKPILDNVDSELIITDTGSTDKTVEIAKKYTDQVLHFDWVNDFSAARNTALDIAKGMWFMFLDADEIFRNCDDIISFFKTGEYEKYNSATYVIRNLSENGNESDFDARRMVRRSSDVRFTGVIHEHFNSFREPVKYLRDIADHYGYLYSDEQLRKEKFERNYSLLLKKYEEVKDKNPMIYAEMYDTLAVGSRQSEADEYLEKGIAWCLKHDHPILILLYCKKARHLLYLMRNDDALKVCGDYFGMSKEIRSGTLYSDIEILAIMSTAYMRKEEYEKAVEVLERFFDVFIGIKSGKVDTNDKLYGSVTLASDHNYISYVGQFIVACLSVGKYELAAEYLTKLPLAGYTEDRETYDEIIKLEAELLKRIGDGYTDRFCTRLDEYGKNRLYSLLGKKVEKTASSEFDKLAAVMKNNVRKMISTGDLVSARKYITEYSKLKPDDPEITEITELIDETERRKV